MHGRDYIEIGPCPAGEDAAQLGTPGFEQRNIAECRRFIAAIKKKVGEPPEGAELRIRPNFHDFGVYREVACYYTLTSEAAVEYAFKCEAEAPETWAEVGFTAPKVEQAARSR
jgi:hypothetical protein